MRERLVSAAFGAGWTLICRMPESWARAAFMAGAGIAWRRQGHRVQVLEGNLRRVLGPDADGKELRTLSRAVMRSYARYYLEVFRLQVTPTQRIVDGMHTKGPGEENIFKNLKAGRGVVLALPHMGNFEQAGAWIIAEGAGSFTTVVERLEPESLYERYRTFRESIGMEVLPATGGPHPFGVLAQRLRAGKLVCLVSDRDLTDSGVEVDFFGEKARMAAGPAALAIQTGAALMPVACWFEGDSDWGAHIYDEIPVPPDGDRKQKVQQMIQQVADVFEDGIREHPSDWHMLQRLFTADLDPDRLRSEP